MVSEMYAELLDIIKSKPLLLCDCFCVNSNNFSQRASEPLTPMPGVCTMYCRFTNTLGMERSLASHALQVRK